jgi:hypothetical protein
MTKITVSADCGNAPKKEFLKEINIAFNDIQKSSRPVP